MPNPLFRLAPTPSGYLHQGNAFNFLLNWLHARQMGARLWLRIDDLDAARTRPEYLSDIFDTLQWLQLDWDLGPTDSTDFQTNWSQQLRLPHYEQTLQTLVNKGLVFACTCTRKTLQEAGFSGGGYPGICNNKKLPLRPKLPWRLHVPPDAMVRFHDWTAGAQSIPLGMEMGSFVIKTRDGTPAYQLASLCDDMAQGVTHIIRGEDLRASTAAQLYIAQLLNWTDFQRVQWYHHPLLKDRAGEKLAKSAGSLSIRALRHAGYALPALLRDFANWAGLPANTDARTPAELLPFVEKINA